MYDSAIVGEDPFPCRRQGADFRSPAEVKQCAQTTQAAPSTAQYNTDFGCRGRVVGIGAICAQAQARREANRLGAPGCRERAGVPLPGNAAAAGRGGLFPVRLRYYGFAGLYPGIGTFPFLHALGPNQEYQSVREKLDRLWLELGVPHLDLLPVFEGLPPRRVTVNRFDAHPNEYANQLAAAAIDPWLQGVVGAWQKPYLGP